MAEPQVGAGPRVAVLLAAALLLLAGLGGVDAWAPDEPRYIQVAEELRSGEHGAAGLVVLHLNGAVYTQKPPLYYWLAALASAPAQRVTELAARLPSALAGIGLIALTLMLGTRCLGGRAGVLGAALLLTVFEFAHLARRVQLDMLLALLETTALLLFWRLDRGIGARGVQLAALHGALGLAVLTKGPVGFLVPVLVMATYLGWERRLRDLARVLPAWGLLLSIGPGLAWLLAATTLAPAGFASDAVGTNVFGRFFSGTSHARPFYYFLRQFPVDFLPWTLLWPWVYLAGRRILGAAGDGPAVSDETRRAWRFLLAWVGASLVFFSLSSGKRGLYLLPAFPATALLCADALLRSLSHRTQLPRGLGTACAVFGTLLFVVAAELALAAGTGRSLLLANPALPELSARVSTSLAALERPLMVAFGVAVVSVISLSLAAYATLRHPRGTPLGRFGVLVTGAFGIELAAFLLLYPALDPTRSPRPIARAAASITLPGESVGLVGDRAMLGGLVYYGGRRVEELSSPESIRQFVEGGGRALVVKRRKLARVTDIAPVEVVTRTRAGSREVLVVSPRRPAGDGAARRRTAP